MEGCTKFWLGGLIREAEVGLVRRMEMMLQICKIGEVGDERKKYVTYDFLDVIHEVDKREECKPSKHVPR